jgi:hypothetical protein
MTTHISTNIHTETDTVFKHKLHHGQTIDFTWGLLAIGGANIYFTDTETLRSLIAEAEALEREWMEMDEAERVA